MTAVLDYTETVTTILNSVNVALCGSRILLAPILNRPSLFAAPIHEDVGKDHVAALSCKILQILPAGVTRQAFNDDPEVATKRSFVAGSNAATCSVGVFHAYA